MLNLNELAQEAAVVALKRENNGGPSSKKMLKRTATEVVEAQEALTYYKCGTVELTEVAEELADIIICVLITAHQYNINIEEAINFKMEKNSLRALGIGDKK